MANEEAQKHYLRKHYAKLAELAKDEQWTANGTRRLSYFEKVEEIQASQGDAGADAGTDRDDRTDAASADRDGFPF